MLAVEISQDSSVQGGMLLDSVEADFWLVDMNHYIGGQEASNVILVRKAYFRTEDQRLDFQNELALDRGDSAHHILSSYRSYLTLELQKEFSQQAIIQKVAGDQKFVAGKIMQINKEVVAANKKIRLVNSKIMQKLYIQIQIQIITTGKNSKVLNSLLIQQSILPFPFIALSPPFLCERGGSSPISMGKILALG